MDTQSATTFGLSSGAVATILLIYKFISYTKGHLLILRCCGRKLDIGYDVKDSINSDDKKENMTIIVDNPMKKDEK